MQEKWVEAGSSWIAAEQLGSRWATFLGQPKRLEPVLLETFEGALETLRQEQRLDEPVAQDVFAKLVSARIDRDIDGELPDVLLTWMRRIAQALLDEHELGFIDVDFWLRNLQDSPKALPAEAERLRQELVPPAEQRYDAQWGLDSDA